MPLTYRPGDLAEVDFFEVLVDVDGTRRKAWLFLMRLMYSGRDFARIYERQDQISFLVGHVRAFAHFDGVPARVAYDNLRAAVVRIISVADLPGAVDAIRAARDLNPNIEILARTGYLRGVPAARQAGANAWRRPSSRVAGFSC